MDEEICIHLYDFDNNDIEINTFGVDKFHKSIRVKVLGKKKKYYLEKFNPTFHHQQKTYLEANIPQREMILII